MQLDNWLVYQRHWCEHKPSVTISVKDEDWVEVGAWVWKHFDEISLYQQDLDSQDSIIVILINENITQQDELL